MDAIEVIEFLENNNWYFNSTDNYYYLDVSNTPKSIKVRIDYADIINNPDKAYKHIVTIMTKHGVSIIGSLATVSAPVFQSASSAVQTQPSTGITVASPNYVREFLKLNGWYFHIHTSGPSHAYWNIKSGSAHLYDTCIDQDPNGNFQWIKDRTPLPHIFPGGLASATIVPNQLSTGHFQLPSNYNPAVGQYGNTIMRHTGHNFIVLGTPQKCECGGTKANTSHSTWCPVYKPFK